MGYAILLFSLIISCFIVGIIYATIFLNKPIVYSNSTINPITLNDKILSSLVNEWRINNNLQPFTKNEKLCEITQNRVKEIQVTYSHIGFIEKNLSTKHNAYFGENIGRGYTKEQDILNEWLNSPNHLNNLKNPIYTQTCISCENNYCVQIFSSIF